VSLYLNCEKKIRIVRLAILSYKVFRVRILSYSINWDLQVIQSELWDITLQLQVIKSELWDIWNYKIKSQNC